MAYAVYDNNGIGDVTGNGRSIVGSASFPWMHSNMEAQIHQLEQEAYCAVLRAFKAQSDAISWEKESLITELRKELRVSDDEHRELLTKVNGDDIIRRIRDWRQAGGNNTARISASQHDLLPSPGVTTSRKKQRTSQSGHSFPGVSSMKSMHYPSAVPGRPFSRNMSSNFSAANPPEAVATDQLIGRKVWTRWPEDNNFYKAVITEYNQSEAFSSEPVVKSSVDSVVSIYDLLAYPALTKTLERGRHLLVYDMDTANETWEWVDLKEISPDDIRWDGDDPGASQRWNHGRGQARFGRTTSAPGIGRGRGYAKGHFGRENLPTQNGNAKIMSDDIELLNTETLVKEVEKVFDSSHPDLFELEKAKKKLKEHEQALIEAIARLADASDGESDGLQAFTQGQ